MNTHVKALFINEGAPAFKQDDFYQGSTSQYELSALSLFQEAGVEIHQFSDFQKLGIHFTNAVKIPKQGLHYDRDTIEQASYELEIELSSYPNLQAVLCMGDVAKQAYDMIHRRVYKKRILPVGATYKIRKMVIQDGAVRVFPSYILTGKNLAIEKSKRAMIIEDIQNLRILLQF